MSNEYLDMKIRVKNEEHSKQIQEVLFKLGYTWAKSETTPKLLDATYLFMYQSSIVGLHGEENYFNNSPFIEVTLQDLQSLLDIKENNKMEEKNKEYHMLQLVINDIEASMHLLDKCPKSFEMYLKGVINTVRLINKC